jgi:hypothetical protein
VLPRNVSSDLSLPELVFRLRPRISDDALSGKRPARSLRITDFSVQEKCDVISVFRRNVMFSTRRLLFGSLLLFPPAAFAQTGNTVFGAACHGRQP